MLGDLNSKRSAFNVVLDQGVQSIALSGSYNPSNQNMTRQSPAIDEQLTSNRFVLEWFQMAFRDANY